MVDGEERRSWWRRLPKLKLFILFIVIVVLAWVAMPYVQEFFKYERLDLYSYWWTVNSEGDISQVTLRLRNNGTKTLKISKVFVNQTYVNSTDWDSTSRTLPPRAWCWMYITPKSMAFVEDSTYNLTIGTEAGSFFSYLVKAEEGDNMGPEEFNINYASFWGFSSVGGPVCVYLCVENHHPTLPVVVVGRWVNGTSYDGRLWVDAGAAGPEGLCILFDFHWYHVTYNFTLKTASGNVYTYIMKAG